MRRLTKFISVPTTTRAIGPCANPGFDISFRFGPYGAATHHYAPICLNSLLYKTEKDLQEMSRILGHAENAQKFQQRAEERKDRIQKYLWDPARRLFFDYNFYTGVRSSYEYVTTFYPLWAGIATPEQARELAHNLGLFEQAGGLAMSTTDADVQWDYPYGWAPTEIIAIEGLRRYGFNEEANRDFVQFPEHDRGEFPPRWNHPGEIQCGDTLVRIGRPRGVSAERDRLRLDQCRLPGISARTPEGHGRPPGERADGHGIFGYEVARPAFIHARDSSMRRSGVEFT